MNLDKLITISVGVVLALSITMNLYKLQTLIWRAQAKLIYESRTETWGSPRFFPVTSKEKLAKRSDQITNSKK